MFSIADWSDVPLSKPPKKALAFVAQVGFGVFLLKLDKNEQGRKCLKILLGKRKGAHGSGEFSLPGGKPDFMESLTLAVPRELLEETDITVEEEPIKLTWEEAFFPDDVLHFITIYYVYTRWKGEPKLMEPEKCEGWDWYDIENLPEPMFAGTKKAIKKLYQQYEVLLDER
jgi:8-oxo-dGTP diphosphatase